MINSKQLFILALGMTAFMNISASIDHDQEETLSSLQAAQEVVATVITAESVLKNTVEEITITPDTETEDLNKNRLETQDSRTIKVIHPIFISLADAQTLNIEGLELTEGTFFVCNGISYIVRTPVDEEETSQK